MKAFKQNAGNIVVCLFEILIGILLLINPAAFTSGIIIAFGVVLILAGLVNIVRYFRMDALSAAKSQDLLKGLLLLLAGFFCAIKFRWFVATFPVLTILYGLILLVAGLGKVQRTVDLLRWKRKRWFLSAISAAISIIIAVIILSSPFASTKVLWKFTGICMIVDALFDIVALLMSADRQKKDEN